MGIGGSGGLKSRMSGPGSVTVSQSRATGLKKDFRCTRLFFASGEGVCSLSTLTKISLGSQHRPQHCPPRLTRQCLGQTLSLSSVSHLDPSTVASENTCISSGHLAWSLFYLSQISKNFTQREKEVHKILNRLQIYHLALMKLRD